MQVKRFFFLLILFLSFLPLSFAQDARPIVRLIYFLPRDREPQPDIDEKLDRLIKRVQQLYGNQIETHGFGRKTFLFETDASGKAIVHRVIGKFTDAHYSNLSDTWEVWEEIDQRFDTSKNTYVTVIDIMSRALNNSGMTWNHPVIYGLGSTSGSVGKVLVHVNTTFATGHELGHAFGLNHDNRNNAKRILLYTLDRMLNSFCAAEWLEQHRSFNPSGTLVNRNTTIKMLPPTLAPPSYSIRLRFEVTDPDGLHQVQIHASEEDGDKTLRDCKGLNGNPSSTVEFAIGLTPENSWIDLSVMDVYGNITWQAFRIEVAPLLPPPEVVSIPDANLAAAVRQKIGASVTTHTMLNMRFLRAHNRQITALTGLEHARNLWSLSLGSDFIPEEETSVNSNAVSDFSPLEGLTQLQELNLHKNAISDVSTLSKLTQLRALDLEVTGITDVAPLAKLIQLERLFLSGNTGITDIAPLAKLTQLSALYLGATGITDIAPLTKLTQLRELALSNTGITDVTPLTKLTQLTFLNLSRIPITDIAFLAKLTRLTHLFLRITGISDIAPLAKLTQLIILDLSHNPITDIAPLTKLTQMEFLYLNNTGISDVAFLTKLTQLISLHLRYNRISDVTPLTKLTQLGFLNLIGNPLSYASINTHIPTMQAKGVEVRFDSRTPTRLVKISGAAQEGSVNTALPLPFIVEVRDEQNQAFSGVPVTFTVPSGGGKLSATTVSTDAAGRASAHLTLGRTAGTTTVRVAVAEISRPVKFTATAVPLSAPVTITDANLRGKIIETLDKPRGGTLTGADMLKLTALVANNANIHDLTGLQHAPNLKTLLLNNNNLSDISLPGTLTHLTVLSLNGNNISDVSPLGVLTGLETLRLDDNKLSDVIPLAGLTQLKTLSLNNNNISNIVPLETLTQLKTLYLRGNLLSYPSLHTSVPAIQANGTTVTVDLRAPTTLVKVSGTHGVAGASLPFIVEVQDGDGFGFSGVPVTFTVTAGGGHLSPPNVITDSTGRASTTLTLGATPNKNTVSVAAVEVQRPALFTITAINANSPVPIPDVNLRAKIAEVLDKPVGVHLTAGDMLTLTKLEAPNADIQTLAGLEHASNLRRIWARGITDVTPLAGLTQLKELQFGGGTIADVTPLAGLTQLSTLILSGNTITDVTPLAALTRLSTLILAGNTITDVTPLAGLTRLEKLLLEGNTITDVTPLAALTQLNYLALADNTITDVSPLAGLTQLNYLYLHNNAISNVAPLSELTQLRELELSNNTITDVSPLAGLTQLNYLGLIGNTITDVSPLVGLKLPGTEWSSTELYLDNNPLSYASIHTHIPAMQAKGVEVRFDDVAHPALLKISGDRQEGMADEVLPKPFVVEAMDAQGKPMKGVSVTFAIATGGGRLSATTAITDANGRTQTTLTLGQPSGKYTVRVSASGIQSSVIFTANATEPPIYWIEKNKGTLHRSTGTTVKNPVPSVRNAISLAIDTRGGKLYWTQQTSNNTGKIQRANLDGSNLQLVKKLTSVPRGLAIDTVNGKLYLTNAWGKIQRLNFDGSNFESNLITDLDAPKSVVLDVMKGKLYWIEQTSKTTGKIQRANLDGSNLQLVKKLTSVLRGLAIDTVNGKLYLTNAWGKIQRLNLDGSNFEPNFITGLDAPEGIALDIARGKLYWTEMDSIKCGDLSGGNVQEVIAGLGRPRSIALTIVPVEPAIAAAPARLPVLSTTTGVLPNYPNPFNPETWIPYQLAAPSAVTLTIYGVDGRVVRRLALGHQPAGVYHGKSRAAYWDGRNEQGERVASGIYFYTLSAGDFTATRKMLIRK